MAHQRQLQLATDLASASHDDLEAEDIEVDVLGNVVVAYVVGVAFALVVAFVVVVAFVGVVAYVVGVAFALVVAFVVVVVCFGCCLLLMW